MSSPDSRFPAITAVEWLSAKEVLGGEATDFTPWLQQPQSMELLGADLKLEDLSAVAVEHNVLGKRLDILATALDENGEEIPVCIENQYGESDADHLGRLIAYLAQQDRGRAVWVVERAHDAFIAAVRFLNRTSSDEVGYYLVQVRFTHGPGGGHQVHFEVLAAPIAWERTGKARHGGARPANTSKIGYLEEIHELVRSGLLSAGFVSTYTHAHGSYLRITWPVDLWYRTFARWVDIKVTRSATRVCLYVSSFSSREANTAAMRILHDRYGSLIEGQVPTGTLFDWTAGGGGVREIARAELPGTGYVDGDAAAAAAWAGDVIVAWLTLLRSQPIENLADLVEREIPGEGALVDGVDEDEMD